jgi:two-component system response regulator PilR (NtrC family)
LPPLRDRGEDLPALVLEFARRYPDLYHRIESLEPDLLQYLRACRFEGNVRELENAVQRTLFMKTDGDSLTRADWLRQESESSEQPSESGGIPRAANLLWMIMLRHEMPFTELMRQIEGELLRRALKIGGKTRREIAQFLKTSERTLYHKMSVHGIGGGPRQQAG